MKLLLPIAVLLLLFACQKADDLDRTNGMDFTSPAALGGRMLSGYQNGALFHDGQSHAIPQLIFDQINNYDECAFSTPYISLSDGFGNNPKPWESAYQTKSHLGTRTDCEGEESLGPVKSLYSTTTPTDLQNASKNINKQYQCAPFATVSRMTSASFGLPFSAGNSYPYYHRMAENPGNSTMFSELVDYNPSFLVAWLGVEDIYDYALAGAIGTPIMDALQFNAKVDSMLGVLSASGTKGVLATIPNIEDIPYFNTVPYNGLEIELAQADLLNGVYGSSQFDHISFQEGPNPFIMNDSNASQGIRQLNYGEKLMLTSPLDSMKCSNYGSIGNYFQDRYVLTLSELSEIKLAISSYNTAIKTLANKYDFALFDANAYYKTVNSGITWNGVDYSYEFVTGNFFSLDGFFPSQKGYTLLANGMIKAINKKYKTHLPTTNCMTCEGTLFP